MSSNVYRVHVRRTNGEKQVYEAPFDDHDHALSEVLDQLNPDTVRTVMTLVQRKREEEKEAA